MSGSKRRSTVHDLASLRLHPDGTKVANSDSNLQPRRAKYSTRDARGNWIAQDAGGLGRVKTRRSAQKNKDPESEDQESFGLSVAEKGKGRATDNHAQEGQDLDEEEYVPRDARAKKKLTFQHDLAFLDPPGRDDSVSRGHSGSSVALALESCASHTANSGIPQPSSDLLKCIHYFASTYYAEMGQLRDSSRDHRREKKRRKLERSEASSSTRVARPGKKINGVDGAYDEASSSSSEDSENETLEAEEQRAKRVSTDKSGVGRRKRRIRTETAHADVDMYKICDGSALMAIGMLLQQHVADLLSPRKPDSWEEAMMEHGEKPLTATREQSERATSRLAVLADVDAPGEESEDESDCDELMERVHGGRGDEEFVPGSR